MMNWCSYDAGLVSRRRAGTSMLYDISDPMVFKLCDLVCRSETQKSRREFEALSGRAVTKEKR
jgi:hypothetical protein